MSFQATEASHSLDWHGDGFGIEPKTLFLTCCQPHLFRSEAQHGLSTLLRAQPHTFPTRPQDQAPPGFQAPAKVIQTTNARLPLQSSNLGNTYAMYEGFQGNCSNSSISFSLNINRAVAHSFCVCRDSALESTTPGTSGIMAMRGSRRHDQCVYYMNVHADGNM